MYSPPPPGTYIALLAIIGFVVVSWPPTNRWLRAGSFAIALLLAGLEIHNLYRDRDERDKEQAITRSEEREAFKTVADTLIASMTKNQQAFDLTMERMKGLAALGKDSLNEVTGGESFCFVDMGSIPEGLITNLVQRGKYPLSDIRVSITDLNALETATKSGAPTLARATRNFPTIDFLGKASLFHPLGVYRVEPREEYLRYNIAIEARNGSFTELLRLKKLKEGGWTSAMLIVASYITTKKKGIVLENTQHQFPLELLKTDQDWNNLKKLSAVKIAE